jgi:hypothetical protein
MIRRLLLTGILLTSSTVLAQNSAVYLQAAQIKDEQAAGCANPAGASCYRQMARYNRCLAAQYSGGGSCTPTACTPSCARNNGVGGAGVGAAANNLTPKEQLAVTGLGLLLNWAANRNAKKDAQDLPAEDSSDNQAQQEANQAALVAAQEAAEQQRLNDQAAQILQQSNVLLASNDATLGIASPTGAPNSTAVIGSLLDSDSTAPDSTSAINALLNAPDGTNGDAPTTSTAAVSALLDAPDGTNGDPSLTPTAAVSALLDSPDDSIGDSPLGPAANAAALQASNGLQSGASSSSLLAPQSSSTPVIPGPDIQYENLDHPAVPSVITYGTPQQPEPLYTWSPDNPGSIATYCKGQPNVPCEIDFPGAQSANSASSAPATPAQLTRPDPVTAPNSSADCDALNQSWSQVIAAASANHQSCLNYYIGQGRTGTGTDSGSLCWFQACQQIHNTWTRSMSDGAAAVASCRQALP